MPRPGPRRQYVGARMSDEQIAALDAAAEREGVDRSEIVRRAVDAWIVAQSYTLRFDPSALVGDENGYARRAGQPTNEEST